MNTIALLRSATRKIATQYLCLVSQLMVPPVRNFVDRLCAYKRFSIAVAIWLSTLTTTAIADQWLYDKNGGYEGRMKSNGLICNPDGGLARSVANNGRRYRPLRLYSFKV